ncbi:MAG: hypothetical protein R3F65_15060 [bacterium]
MKAIVTLCFALFVARPALADAGPPGEIERHRAALEEMQAHPQAAAVAHDLDELRYQLDRARERWQQGNERALATLLTRVEAQTALVRARLAVEGARAMLGETERALAETRAALEAERARHAALQARLEGGR